MNVEPARVDQIRSASDGRMVLIDADVGGVAADLKAHDPELKVRLAEAAQPPCWIVFREIHKPDGQIEQQLVTTAQAFESNSGVFTGLDQRLVERIKLIDAESRSGYDFVAELDKQNQRGEREKMHARHEKFGETHEQLAHALRKDLGVKSRAFIG
jgi:hypothetical protein